MRYFAAITAAIIMLLLLAANCFPAPQHWGFGFGYLVVLEEDSSGKNVLSVYEPPLL